jgi:hypothetical protein
MLGDHTTNIHVLAIRGTPHCTNTVLAGSPHNKCPCVRYTTLYKYFLGHNTRNVHVLGEFDQSKGTYFHFLLELEEDATLEGAHHSQLVTQGRENSIQMVMGSSYIC